MDKKKRRKQVLQRKPLGILYDAAVRLYARPTARRKYNWSGSGEEVRGPALILSNHTSNLDHIFLAAAVRPARISFLVTYHFFTFRKLNFWLRICGAIPKFQFATDLEAMRRIQYVIQHGGVVYIAPEGTVYSSGHLGYISPAIAKMIRFLKVPVYTCRIQGAGLGNAKWSEHRHRGKVTTEIHRLLDADEAASLGRDEVMARIVNALTYDEFRFAKENGVTVEGHDKAEGFETMFYRCPSCGSEFTLHSRGNDIWCDRCSARATIQDDFTFIWNTEKQYFENYGQWYDWQYDEMRKEVSNEGFRLEEEMDYGTDEPGVDNYVKIGHGTLTLSHRGWDFKGVVRGEAFEEHDDPKAVFLATLKAGRHIELPERNGHCRVYYPSDGNRSMKWHLASRAMSDLYGDS